MGDRIAILKQQSKIAQYDTPEKILTDPADDFVADFIGGGASIKRLSLSTVEDIEPADWPVASLADGYEQVQEKMRSSNKGYVLLLDDQDRPSRWVGAEDIENDDTSLEDAGRPAVAIVEASSSLYNTLDTMITSYKGSAIVVDGEGRYQGVVDFDTVLEAINAMRPEEQTRDRAKRDVQPEDGGR
jgi:osmoprotectant transport system ATP-binding protein